MTIQTIMFHLWYFKHTKIEFKKMPAKLGGSFNYVFTLVLYETWRCFISSSNVSVRKVFGLVCFYFGPWTMFQDF